MRTHRGGLDEEPPQNTADGKAKQLCGHHQHPLVYSGFESIEPWEVRCGERKIDKSHILIHKMNCDGKHTLSSSVERVVLTAKVIGLVVVHSLDSNNVGLNE